MTGKLLTIYKASAGSGKTYTLAREYICMMFERVVRAGALRQPGHYAQFANAHRELLAVTFTNKATNEMKSRIVRELYRLALHLPSGYRGEICRRFGLTDDENLVVDTWCGIFLNDILDDYGLFSITTIDSFFQKIVRQFARELNLPGGYVVDMDEEQIRTMAVDNMLYDIDTYPLLKQWLQQMVAENIDNGKNWNVHKQILKRAKILFDERFRSLLQRPEVEQLLLNPNEAKGVLEHIVASRETEIEALYQNMQAILAQYGLGLGDMQKNADFSKLISCDKPGKTILTIVSEHAISKCFSAASIKKGRAAEAFENGVYDCYRSALQIIKRWMTAQNILQSFYIVGIVGTLDRQMEADNRENNRLPLADTNRRLQQIIDGSDIPFIYEKISQRIKHYLIDEFQDTSRLQWNNFSPLVRDSLDSGFSNLIVGDVKQSIYRWRNGDADLLAHRLADELPQFIQEKTLETNYRSCPQIVRWNNDFFAYLIGGIDGTKGYCINQNLIDANNNYNNRTGDFTKAVTSYYDESICQKINLGNNYSGCVELTFFPQPLETEGQETANDLLLEKQLIALLDRLTKERGIQPNRISIMVRKNVQGTEVANMLTRNNYKVVSNESLTLASAVSVRLIISIFRHVERPSENLYIYNAFFFFAALLGYDTKWVVGQNEFYQTRMQNGESVADTLLGKAESILSQSDTLYQKTELLINWLTHGCDVSETNLIESETAYLQTLLDCMHRFASNRSTDLHAFLQWWDMKGSEAAIPAPEQDDAVQIITIHKAKGLEFDVAIMPYCSADLVDTKNEILWVEPAKEQMSEPFRQIPLLPVVYQSKLALTECAQVYWREYMHRFLDMLNTFYVAFTRPRYELYLFSDAPKSENITTIGDVLFDYVTNRLQLTNVSDSDEVLTYRLADAEGRTDWVQTIKEQSDVRGINIPDMLRYVPINDRLTIQEIQTEETLRGNLLHSIMSCVRYADELEAAIAKICTGTETDNADDIRRQLTEIISLPDVAPWFEHDHLVLNEWTIMTSSGKQFRPDRIMLYPNGDITVVDYKFTSHRSDIYNQQVLNYIELIRQAMPEFAYEGKMVKTRNISGYLLYADAGKTEKIV